ncbi:hypothetical protein DL769_004980 [Monosporascus sp. CRB-8-3]|nr:hypothetical protein DL769_004980 [Monosporascus sp. CRB-8-3]
MATIHVFRHAEGMHNRFAEFRKTRDPDLTEEGGQQCRGFAAEFPYMDKVTHLVASPMRRAINSTILAFAPVSTRQKIMLLPELTEAGSRVSSFGSDPSELLREFGDKIDLDAVPKQWNRLDASSQFAYSLEKIEARTAAAREWLMELALAAGEDSHIVVMTHGQTAHFVTDDFEGVRPPKYTCDWRGNLEYRSYRFDFASGKMVETPESRTRRGMPPAYTLDEATKKEIKDVLWRRILERTPEVHELYEAYKL